MMAVGSFSLAKELFRLQKNLKSFTNGQVKVLDQGDDLEWISLEVHPQDGPYAFGKFVFKINLTENFPESTPVVNCETEIYHPNIDSSYECDESGNVCVSLLDDWDGSQSLEDLVQALLFLMYEPNTGDPLSSCCPVEDSEEEFKQKVYMSLLGCLTYDTCPDRQFLTRNFHPPQGEDEDDYMFIRPLFHDVDCNASKVEEASSSRNEGTNSEQQEAAESASTEAESVGPAAGVITRQLSKVERAVLSGECTTPASHFSVCFGRLLCRQVPQVMCKELVALAMSIIESVVTL